MAPIFVIVIVLTFTIEAPTCSLQTCFPHTGGRLRLVTLVASAAAE